MKHISFPSIDQFRNAIKAVKSSAKYHEVPVPTVTFEGTVKLHGTNAAVCMGSDGVLYTQSRERLCTIENDNAGFAAWAHGEKEFFKRLMTEVEKQIGYTDKEDVIQVYGEWCGGNIQKGVGLSLLPKMFVIFGIRVSVDAAGDNWLSGVTVAELVDSAYPPASVHTAWDFKTWTIDVDMNNPQDVQNRLGEITEEVEKCCPVAKALLGDTDQKLVGEGVVWTAVSSSEPMVNVRGLRYKVKGTEHSSSKVKVLAAVDVEKVANVREFVETVCTPSRLNQGIEKLREQGLEIDAKNTGAYIKWVMGDIVKEEADTLSANGLSFKDVTGGCAQAARNFFLSQI